MKEVNTTCTWTVDLQLNGNQINLSERPNADNCSTITEKKINKSLQSCCFKRPMTASPTFGHHVGNKNKKLPTWSRPQSAESSNHRHSKYAANCTGTFFQDPECFRVLAETNTLSSPQPLQSIIERSSITKALDSVQRPTSSSQHILRGSINITSQLEPGLVTKPPLQRTILIPRPGITDDIIGLEFQQWFPDSILESDVTQKTFHNNETNNPESVCDSENGKNGKKGNSFNSCSSYETYSYNHVVNTSENGSKKGHYKKTISSHPINMGKLGNIVSKKSTSVDNFKSFTPSHPFEKCNNPYNITMKKFLSLSNINDFRIVDNSNFRKIYSDSNIFQGNEVIGLDNFKRISDNESEKTVTLNNNFRQSGSETVISEENEALSSEKCMPVLVTNDDKNIFTYDISHINCNTNCINIINKGTFEQTGQKTGINYDKEYGNCATDNTMLNFKTKTNEDVLNDNIFNVSTPLLQYNCLEFNTRNDFETNSNSSNINSLMNKENNTYMNDAVFHVNNYGLTENLHCKGSSLSDNINHNMQNKTKYHLNEKYNKSNTVVNMRKYLNKKDGKSIEDVKRGACVSSTLKSKDLLNQSKCPPLNAKTQKNITHEVILEYSERDSTVSSYEDIVTMIKVLEREDLKSSFLPCKDGNEHFGLGVPSSEQSSSAKELMTFLDEVERGTEIGIDTNQNVAASKLNISRQDGDTNFCLGTLLNTDASFLAQQIMSQTLQLEVLTAECQRLENHNKQSIELLKQHEIETTKANKRQQSIIDKIMKEKRQLVMEYESAIHELKSKNASVIKSIEERHKVDMKKAQEKYIAAEKIRRDKWIDTKTKKIKELTVRGLEPELQHMAATHQEELAVLRRHHQRQLSEVETAWTLRLTALREQEARERQAAIMREREAAQYQLEQELNQIEKSYHEQRRRQLEEVRQEKDLLHRQNERIIIEKQNEMEKKVDRANKEMQAELVFYEKKHKEEMQKVKENAVIEKQVWMSQQLANLEAREAALKQDVKHDRDRHIELAIRRLETEAAAKEEVFENKLKKLKESYDVEFNGLDTTVKEIRSHLKEAQADLQKSEDKNSMLLTQLGLAQDEVHQMKQAVDKLKMECYETKQQSKLKEDKLQKEILEAQGLFQDKVNKICVDKERQLHDLYNRVKIAISKKEEALSIVIKQRDAAVEQCGRLNEVLKTQQKQALKMKN